MLLTGTKWKDAMRKRNRIKFLLQKRQTGRFAFFVLCFKMKKGERVFTFFAPNLP